MRCILAILANAPWVKSFGENCGRFSLVFWRVSLETLPFLRRKNVLFFLLTFCCKSWVPGGKGKKRRSQRDRLFFSGSNMGVFCGDISWRILLNDYWILDGKSCGNSSCLQKFSSFSWMILPSQNSWSYGRRCWGLAKQHVELAEDWGGVYRWCIGVGGNSFFGAQHPEGSPGCNRHHHDDDFHVLGDPNNWNLHFPTIFILGGVEGCPGKALFSNSRKAKLR